MEILIYDLPFLDGTEFMRIAKNSTVHKIEMYLLALRYYDLANSAKIRAHSSSSNAFARYNNFQLEITLAEEVDPIPMTEMLQQYGAVLLSEGSEKE